MVSLTYQEMISSKKDSRYEQDGPDEDTAYCNSKTCIINYLEHNDAKYKELREEYRSLPPEKEFNKDRIRITKIMTAMRNTKLLGKGIVKHEVEKGTVYCPLCDHALFWEYKRRR